MKLQQMKKKIMHLYSVVRHYIRTEASVHTAVIVNHVSPSLILL